MGVGGGGHGPVDELGLAAIAVGRDDETAGDLIGVGGAEAIAEEFETGVEASGGAGGGEDTVVFDVEHVCFNLGGGEGGGHVGGAFPMRCGAATVKEARRGEDVSAEAQADDQGATGMSSTERSQQWGGWTLVDVAPAGDDDDVVLSQ